MKEGRIKDYYTSTLDIDDNSLNKSKLLEELIKEYLIKC